MSTKSDSDDGLPQNAFRNLPFTDEDAYFAEQEKITRELLAKEREARFEEVRVCLRPSCQSQVMERLTINEVEIDKCPKCSGVWLDAGEIDLLVKRAKGSKNGLVRFFYDLAGRTDD